MLGCTKSLVTSKALVNMLGCKVQSGACCWTPTAVHCGGLHYSALWWWTGTIVHCTGGLHYSALWWWTGTIVHCTGGGLHYSALCVCAYCFYYTGSPIGAVYCAFTSSTSYSYKYRTQQDLYTQMFSLSLKVLYKTDNC